MRQSEAGKGSKQRPTDLNKYSNNWDTIFGRKYIEEKCGGEPEVLTEEDIKDRYAALDELNKE